MPCILPSQLLDFEMVHDYSMSVFLTKTLKDSMENLFFL